MFTCIRVPTRAAAISVSLLLAGIPIVLASGCNSSSKSSHSGNGIRLLAGDWTLQSIEGKPLPDTVRAQSRRPSLAFAKDGKVSGSGGVNRLMSSVDLDALDNGVVKLAPVASTLMAGPPEMMDVENRYKSALDRANRFALDGPALVLFHDKSELLRFTSAGRPLN